MSSRAVLAKKIAQANASPSTMITTTTITTSSDPRTSYFPFIPIPSFAQAPAQTQTPVTTTTATPSFLRMQSVDCAKTGTVGVTKSPPTKDDDYKIVMILDESGSMEPTKSSIVDSINDLIRQQKAIKERPTLFTLIKFNSQTHTIRQNAPFDETDFISNKDYTPSGGTALYDAIGEAIEAYKAEKNVLMVIITDGEENASRRYSKSEVAPKIDELKADTDKGWSFVYIGCDLATAKQGYAAGFNTCVNSCNYRTDSRAEMCGALGAVSKGMIEQRTASKTSGSLGYGVFQTNLQSKMKM